MILADNKYFPGLTVKAGLLMAVSLLLLWGCAQDNGYRKFEGATMGTRYHITVKLPKGTSPESLHQQLQQKLEVINRSMSTWRDDSLITQFNKAPVGSEVTVDADFMQVLAISRAVYQASGGAFNPAVAPLIELWGFGRSLSVDQLQHTPSEEAIKQALAHIRFGDLQNREMTLLKQDAIELNFSAVAKGYAVDALAAILREQGIDHYMVEIGGEVATLGNNPRGAAWRIGIESPDNIRGHTLTAISVHQAAMATSGDYRNFLEIDGQRYSHTIDPRTGWPMINRLASVTVLADSVGLADAWATAMMVVGEEEALQLAERQQLAVYLIVRTEEGFVSRHSSAMKPYLN